MRALLLLCIAVAAPHRDGRLTTRPHAPENPSRQTGLVPLGLGEERDGMLFVPSSYDPARPAPLLLLLRGARGGPEHIFKRFRDAAERAGTIVVVPEARDRTWDIVVHRGFGADVAFIDRALERVLARYNVDPARVADGGFSDGASYALSLGLGNGDLFRRIVAFSPGFAAPGKLVGKPRVFVAHGTADSILPIDRTSRQIVPQLREHGYDVRYVEFDDDHLIRDDILDAAFAFLAEK